MAAILYTLLFIMGGAAIIRMQLPGKSPLVRAFLGLALGILLEMQLPALCANLFDFTLKAHYVAAVLLMALAGVSFALRDEREAKKTPFYDLPFIYIEKHLISPDDEVLFPYLHNGKYKAIARNKRLGKWKRLEADDKIVLETMLRDTFIEWHKESEAGE